MKVTLLELAVDFHVEAELHVRALFSQQFVDGCVCVWRGGGGGEGGGGSRGEAGRENPELCKSRCVFSTAVTLILLRATACENQSIPPCACAVHAVDGKRRRARVP